MIVDGRAVLACLTLAVEAQGKEIRHDRRTWAPATRLAPAPAGLRRRGAIQCGFCTPGMILSAKALLDENPHPGRQEVRRAIAGNLCRCTGYAKIVEAIEVAAARRAVDEDRAPRVPRESG